MRMHIYVNWLCSWDNFRKDDYSALNDPDKNVLLPPHVSLTQRVHQSGVGTYLGIKIQYESRQTPFDPVLLSLSLLSALHWDL
jgi:hypothetical protein